eukprot:86955-Pyramimonas_sp.AAC.1
MCIRDSPRTAPVLPRLSLPSSSVYALATCARAELASADDVFCMQLRNLACATHARHSGLCLY